MSTGEISRDFRGFHWWPQSELEVAYLLGFVAQPYLPFPLLRPLSAVHSRIAKASILLPGRE